MAAVDPYAPCPCGSGQKFKWCCHKVEAFADKAQRLFEGGQVEAALAALEEGLRKEPANPWLLTRKAVILVRAGQAEAARATLGQILAVKPDHLGAQMLLTRVVLESEGPAAAAAQFQRALATQPAGARAPLAGLARVLGAMLSEVRDYVAARKHLELALELGEDVDGMVDRALQSLDSGPSISPWLKDSYRLTPIPAGLSPASHGRFAQALGRAEEGLWTSAAADFEAAAADPAAAAASWRNAGLCRLWAADHAGGVAALRRSIPLSGKSTEAVDLEALCQQVAPADPESLVERVQLIWPLRDRARLMATLAASPQVEHEGVSPIDPADEESPEVEQYALLDRAKVGASPGLKADQVPRIAGRILVGAEIAVLEASDDGRLDALGDRFTAMAGTAIAPAHPRTKVLGKLDRVASILMWEWLLPPGLDAATAKGLEEDERARVLREVWPATPNPALRNRTPAQAAKAGDAEVPLRASLMALEVGRQGGPASELRRSLGLAPEPAPDIHADDFDLESLHLARLALVPVDLLDDAHLVTLYLRARSTMMAEAMERAARALASRPAAWDANRVNLLSLFSDLASLAAGRDQPAEAADWVAKGRAATKAAFRGRDAVAWDMLEVRLKARSEPPEAWVPELAVVLDRYREDRDANQTILMNLVDMGLVNVAPNPDSRGDVMLDPRPLQAVLAEFGPKVTTASGRLGVSATKGEIWTPGSSTPSGGGGGGLWTPGSAAPGPAGDKPKLIIPGR